jgi:hypothetical protein
MTSGCMHFKSQSRFLDGRPDGISKRLDARTFDATMTSAAAVQTLVHIVRIPKTKIPLLGFLSVFYASTYIF